MAGPKAPKDPTAKGSSFYICRQKAIAGNPQPDGRGIQYIYLNDVRLTTFAKMVGNVTDETMIENLRRADTFFGMVAGIGVSVEAEDPDKTVDFIFQVYGKTDPYASGTQIRRTVRPDGMEQIIWFDECELSEDDDVPGQIRFEFDEAERLATVDVKLYLREGYTAPEQEERTPIDVESEDYRKILARSLYSAGNNARLKGAIDRAKAGEDVTVAFIGGSITQGAGAIPIHTANYAYLTAEKFAKEFGTGDNVHLVKAGIGGTPSELGMIRFERDVLKDGEIVPDIVVIEFAVNDEGDETKGLCYESLIRKALAVSDRTAVVLIFAVFANDWNLQERLGPVGERYMLPMTSVRDGVVEQFYLKSGEGRVLSKSQFFYDSYHPANIGHSIMSDCLMNLFREADRAEFDEDFSWREVTPYFGADFEQVKLLDRESHTEKPLSLACGSFCDCDTELQAVERDASFMATPQFPYNWQHRAGAEPFAMRIDCKALLLVSKDSGSPESGKVRVLVDGSEVKTVDPREVGWTHCNAQIVFNNRESAEHLVELIPAEGDEDKLFTILGFGYVD